MVFHCGRAVVPIRTTLAELGHPQPPSPIKTNNSTAFGILTSTMRQKRSKAFDMKIYWMKDRIQLGEFRLYWDKGTNNWANYLTNHYPLYHRRLIRPKYLHIPKQTLSSVQTLVEGCVSALQDI